MAKKVPSQKTLNEAKITEYHNYVDKNLPKEFDYTSKNRMSKNAIKEFGYTKFSHTSVEAVARRYVGPAMELLGEKSESKDWCWYKSYEPMSQKVVEEWRKILRYYRINEEEAACAWYREQQGEDTSKEKEAFQMALADFKSIYKDTPVLLNKWRHK